MNFPNNTGQAEFPDEYRQFEALLKKQQIGFPECKSCGRYHWYPRPVCPHCSAKQLVWKPAPATGRLFTWTVVRRKLDPEFSGAAPYVVGLVEFEGVTGVRLVTNIIDTPLATLLIGLEVEPVFDTTPEGQPIVHFKALDKALMVS